MKITLNIRVEDDPKVLRDMKSVLEPDFKDWKITLEGQCITFSKEERSPSRARAVTVSLFRAIELYYSIRKIRG